MVLIAFGVVAFLGWRAIYTVPIDAFPDVTPAQVNIYTESPGLAAEDVEQLLTFPIESGMAGLPKVANRTIYLVSKEGAAQSSLRMGHPSIKYDALGEYYRAGLMNFNLGGTSESRIYLNLREDKGYTYGARTGFNGGRELGSFRFSSEINKETTADAIREVLSVLEKYSADGMTEEEYQHLQNAIGQRDALNYETPGAKLGLLAQILRYDLPLDYRKRQQSILKETGRETLNELAAKLIDPDNLAIVVVGDIEEIRPQVEQLELPIRMLDEEGFLIE